VIPSAGHGAATLLPDGTLALVGGSDGIVVVDATRGYFETAGAEPYDPGSGS
jgi:hypothetical protein